MHLSNEAWLTLSIDISERHGLGTARGPERRYVEVTGGAASGRFTGEVLPTADWQTVWPDGTTELEVQFVIRTETGSYVEVRGFGLRSGPSRTMQAANAGKPVDPALLYFRAVYRFITDDPELVDFNHGLFVGAPRREPPGRLFMDIYRIE